MFGKFDGYIIAAVFASMGWLLTSFIKLQKDFYEHQSGTGHKLLMEALNQECARLRMDISELETLAKVNRSNIDNNHEQLRDIAKSVKYKLEASSGRLDLVEEIMRREGYTIFKRQISSSEINRDTLDLEDADED